MPNPSELLALSRLLAKAADPKDLTDARLRRAVSTAYYAVFHKFLRAAAIRFMGTGRENAAGYGILYRSFDHRHMKTVCEALDVSTLKDRYKINLSRGAVSTATRDFVGAFPALQAARHRADYDPTAAFLPDEASSLIDEAETAIATFDRVAPDEQADVLALLMVKIRD